MELLQMYPLLGELELKPYFQPILSLQTQKIIGYEALGRRIEHGRTYSLGSFFQDSTISDESHLQVDRMLREKAIATLSQLEGHALLFINLKPSWIYRMYRETGMLPTLQLVEKHGLDPSRVVIEITEEEFHGKLDELSEIIEVYRQQGCQIAIDDIGSGYSNYDRIASIKPNILKIDLKLLKKSGLHDGYKALLNSFSILSSQMGSSLLIEGVETKQDLYHCLKTGARYVQGFLFSEAKPEFQKPDAYELMLTEAIRIYTNNEVRRYRELFAVQENLNSLVDSDVLISSAEDADAMIGRLLDHVNENVVRIFVCREDGSQVSSNFTRNLEVGWQRDAQFQGSNWIWRPYFIPNMLRMNKQRDGMLSQEYTDLDTSRLMQTFSCPVGEMHYLFLDLNV
jgi:EAL domain-containing protein (putative c-di-GMP-specific phosphodiesterase class I)